MLFMINAEPIGVFLSDRLYAVCGVQFCGFHPDTKHVERRVVRFLMILQKVGTVRKHL